MFPSYRECQKHLPSYRECQKHLIHSIIQGMSKIFLFRNDNPFLKRITVSNNANIKSKFLRKKLFPTHVRFGSRKAMDIISIIIMTSRLLLLHENHGLYINTTKYLLCAQ